MVAEKLLSGLFLPAGELIRAKQYLILATKACVLTSNTNLLEKSGIAKVSDRFDVIISENDSQNIRWTNSCWCRPTDKFENCDIFTSMKEKL